MENEDQQPQAKVVVIAESILQDKRLPLAAKLVYARICYFDEFFEGPDKTAEYLGVSASSVRKAKQTLEKLGYIKCIECTGRGKKYVANVHSGRIKEIKASLAKSANLDGKPTSEGGQNLPISLAKSANQPDKICQSGEQNLPICLAKFANIGKNINKNISKNIGKTIVSKLPDGNETSDGVVSIVGLKAKTVNGKLRVVDDAGNIVGGHPYTEKAYALWEEIMNQPLKRDNWNSIAGYNILRDSKKGEEWLRKMLVISKACKADPKADFRAKNIANLVELQKNWEFLIDWARQKASSQSETQKFQF